MGAVLAQALGFLSEVTGEGGLLSPALAAADGLLTLGSLSISQCTMGTWGPARAVPSDTLST